jgi:hypothetical protein
MGRGSLAGPLSCMAQVTAPQVDLKKLITALGIHTNPWQDAVMACPARHVMMRAARRTGKSETAAKRAMKFVIQPRTRGWIVGPTYDLAHKEFRYILEFTQRYCRLVKQPAPTYRDSPGSGDLYLRTAWGAEVVGKSADNNKNLVGEELDWLIMSEAAQQREETWVSYLRPTLATRKGESIWPYSPDASGLWLYELEEDAKSRPDWSLFTLPAWECPHYDPAEIESQKRDMGGAESDKFAEQVGGEWRFYTGRVYKMVQRAHYVEPFPIPATWRVYSGIDLGLRDPTASEWVAKSPTGEAYVIDEYYRAERSSDEHIASMRELEGQRGYHMHVRIADHHGLGGQLILNFSRQGFKTVACMSHDRRTRRERAINALTRKVRPHPYHVREFGVVPTDPEGLYPDVFFFKERAPKLKKEIEFFRWKESKAREGAASATEGEDHAIDALEYVIEYANLGTVLRRRARESPLRRRVFREAVTTAGQTGYWG